MAVDSIKALLIENDADDARVIHDALATAGGVAVEWVEGLDDGLARLRHPDIDVVLLDLALPDAEGFATLRRLNQAAPNVPIVALSGPENSVEARNAIKFGAEDYLVKDALEPDLLARAIRYASDRRQTREAIAQARDSALESARLRGEFLANMSHEIRTPLNGIVGMTRLLIDTRLTSDQREMIDIARQSADSLLKIVNDILDFSKISAGKVTLEETDFDLGTAVESVVALFIEQAQRKGVELVSFVDNDVPTQLRGDPARLCQILSNLVGNAVKFTAYGDVTVRVGLVSDGEDGVGIRFVVKDTGIGIPLDGQRHLFRAFTQADGSTTRKFGGTGLGLAICAQLVELMGGNIGVQSEPDGGSTFWFTTVFQRQAATATPPVQASARLAGTRILVADHSATVAHVIQEHARDWGMQCEIVVSAAAAMVALKSAAVAGTPYDVALIEMQNGSIDGLTLGRAIKSDVALAHCRVIGMYSLGARPSEAQMRAAGIRALLIKPIKQTQLFNVLSNTASVVAETALAGLGTVNGASRRRRVSELKSQLPEEMRSRIRILLVEDNLVNQQVQLRMLERIGFHADPVNNGREALTALQGGGYEIALMDCQMPEMDGYTATREIRRRESGGAHVVIIGVTAYALPGDREECLACGMDDYVSKPVVPEDLANTLEKWVLRIVEAWPDQASDQEEAETSGKSRSIGNDHTTGKMAASGAKSASPRPPSLEAILDQEVLAELRDCARPGETAFVSGLIGVFMRDLTTRLIALRAGVSRRDADAVRTSAHALRGASAEIGARRMAALCGRIEDGARTGDPSDLRSLIGEIEAEAESLRAALEVEQARASA